MFRWIPSIMIIVFPFLNYAQEGLQIHAGRFYNEEADTLGTMIFDFAQDPVQVILGDSSDMSLLIGDQSYWWNPDGSIRFMSNGSRIHKGNGDTLSVLLEENRGRLSVDDYGYPTGAPGSVFIEKPGDSTKILFIYDGSTIYRINSLEFYVASQNLLYAELHKGESPEQDSIISTGNIAFRDDEIYHNDGRILPIKHANGQDWWIFRKRVMSNVFDVILLDKDGFHYSHETIVETPFLGVTDGSALSWDMSMLFYTDSKQAVDPTIVAIYDIDRCAGTLTERAFIEAIDNAGSGIANAVISKDGRFLYVTTGTHINQYDLHEEDIKASEVIVAQWFGEVCNNNPNDFVAMNFPFRGPDDKIYVFDGYGCTDYTVIEKPHLKGLASETKKFGYQLPYYPGQLQPNIINLDIGALPEGSCITSNDDPVKKGDLLEVFPNPSSEFLTIDLPENLQNLSLQFNILNTLGQVMETGNIPPANQQTLNVSDYPDGVYRIILNDDRGIKATGSFVKLEP